MAALTQTGRLRLEHRHDFIGTDMTASVAEKVLEQMRKKTPLGRLGQAQDVANAYLFLASGEASFINGTVLSVDGGLTL